MQNHIEQQQEHITNKLQKQIRAIEEDKRRLEEKLKAEVRLHETETEHKQQQLLRLQNENYVLNQRIIREGKRLEQTQRDKARLFAGWEAENERMTLESFRHSEELSIQTPHPPLQHERLRRRCRSTSLPSLSPRVWGVGRSSVGSSARQSPSRMTPERRMTPELRPATATSSLSSARSAGRGSPTPEL